MREAGRPTITINRIRPVINLLRGYGIPERNRTGLLPRSEEDDRISRVAAKVLQILAETVQNYQRNKGKCFPIRLFAV